MTSPTPTSRKQEIGDTGVNIFGGILRHEDYVKELAGNQRWVIYEQMRNDSTIAAALNSIKLPLLRGNYSATPVDDSTQAHRHAQFVEDNLFNMTQTFMDWWRQASLMLDYGVMPQEKVWELSDDDGLI